MKKIVIATNNRHKIEEIKDMLKNENIKLITLNDIGCNEEIPENEPTIEGNAYQKAKYIFERYGYDCISDDTGLEVDSLNGQPGVFSARYSKEEYPNVDEKERSKYNILKLLDKMKGITQRNARFRTIICLMENGHEKFFEGVVEGKITNDPAGEKGFGYDPVFIPDGCDKTFAQMSMEEKNQISHRGRAIKKLADYLNSYYDRQ